MDDLLNEDAELVHRAIMSAIRKSKCRDERHCLLLILEHIIKKKTGIDFKTNFYNTIRGTADVILKLIQDEIQHLKMESQVNFILSPSELVDEGMDPFSESYRNMASLHLSDGVQSNFVSPVNAEISFKTNDKAISFDVSNSHISLPNDIVKDNHINQLASSIAPHNIPPSQIRLNDPNNFPPTLPSISTDFTKSHLTPEPSPTMYPGALSAKPTGPLSITINSERSMSVNSPINVTSSNVHNNISNSNLVNETVSMNNISYNSKSSNRFKHESTSSSASGPSSTEDDVKHASNPEVSMVTTVYQHRVLTQTQVESFINNQDLKAQLREIGGFYSISPAKDTNHFNVSVSG